MPDIIQLPYTWIQFALSNLHCFHASIMIWDWMSRVKRWFDCLAPADWKQLPYFCPGLVLSCRLWVDHLIKTPKPSAALPAPRFWVQSFAEMAQVSVVHTVFNFLDKACSSYWLKWPWIIPLLMLLLDLAPGGPHTITGHLSSLSLLLFLLSLYVYAFIAAIQFMLLCYFFEL